MKAMNYLKTIVAASTLVLATATLPTAVHAADFYQVVNVAQNDALNIRSGPGTTYNVIGTIPYNGRTIMTTGASEQVGNSVWQEVVWLGDVGWVNSRYLSTGPVTTMADSQTQQTNNPNTAAGNYDTAANQHTHPRNECTNSITHTHPNGVAPHNHNYSCQPGQARQASRKPADNSYTLVTNNNNPNQHTHPRNECTNSITHTHPNGVAPHSHNYSCKPGQRQQTQQMARPKYSQPKYFDYTNYGQ